MVVFYDQQLRIIFWPATRALKGSFCHFLEKEPKIPIWWLPRGLKFLAKITLVLLSITLMKIPYNWNVKNAKKNPKKKIGSLLLLNVGVAYGAILLNILILCNDWLDLFSWKSKGVSVMPISIRHIFLWYHYLFFDFFFFSKNAKFPIFPEYFIRYSFLHAIPHKSVFSLVFPSLSYS